jgi:hypothetical protein
MSEDRSGGTLGPVVQVCHAVSSIEQSLPAFEGRFAGLLATGH